MGQALKDHFLAILDSCIDKFRLLFTLVRVVHLPISADKNDFFIRVLKFRILRIIELTR